MKTWKSWASAGALLLIMGAAVPARADFRVAYESPGDDPALVAAHDVLVKSQALEELQTFLAPLRLPVNVNLHAAACGAERRDYEPRSHTATLCYEMAARILAVAAGHSDASEDDRRTAVIGTLVEALLHETSYALFDVYNVPVWGRIEDAADRLTALVMTQFGEDTARTTIFGVATFFQWSARTWSGAQFASKESPEAQRFYNFLCVAYGADPIAFDAIVQNGALPAYRSQQCGYEYQQIRKAFDLRMMPFVDPDKLVQARARQW